MLHFYSTNSEPFTNNEQELRVAYKTLPNSKPPPWVMNTSSTISTSQKTGQYRLGLRVFWETVTYWMRSIPKHHGPISFLKKAQHWLECIAAINNGELSEQASTILSFLSQPENCSTKRNGLLVRHTKLKKLRLWPLKSIKTTQSFSLAKKC